jgi:hypothetical protein
MMLIGSSLWLEQSAIEAALWPKSAIAICPSDIIAHPMPRATGATVVIAWDGGDLRHADRRAAQPLAIVLILPFRSRLSLWQSC